MAKKKKKKGVSKPAQVAVRQQDVAVLLQEQKEAFGAMRGRRASVLGERIFLDESADEPLRRRAFAAGHEAYLRELIAKGHAARGRAVKLLEQEGWLSECWALSLQLRLGLVEHLEVRLTEQSWQERLRAELVDPSDLCAVAAGGLGEQARLVLEAWALVERGAGSEARERLQAVGRRSPVVDWRLFVQALEAAGRRDLKDATVAVGRMLEGCPAKRAAEKILLDLQAEAAGYYARRLKALGASVERGRLKTSAYPQLTGLVKHALAEKRPGLAISIASAYGGDIKNQMEANRFFTLFERMVGEGFSLHHVYLRSAVLAEPTVGLLHPDLKQDLQWRGWSNAELARLWIRFFMQARAQWGVLTAGLDDGDVEDAAEDLLFPLLAECRWLVRKISDCHAVYQFWDWAELECGCKTQDGMRAYVEAFPDDPEVLEAAVKRFAAANEFEAAETWLARLRLVRNSETTTDVLPQLMQFHRIKAAFEAGDAAAVEALSEGYSILNPVERVQVAFMRWRVASKGEKRKRGVELAELNLPWLVLYCAHGAEISFRKSELPVALKRSLEDDPDAVLQSGLVLLENSPPDCLDRVSAWLLEALGRGFAHPAVSLERLRVALPAVLLHMRDSYEFMHEADGLMGAFSTLLSGTPNDQAIAVALRVRCVFDSLGQSMSREKGERSLRVAWSLADQEETRRLIAKVNSASCAFPTNLLQKPTSDKQVKAELKMQRRFSNHRQVEERYAEVWHDGFTPDIDDPFEGMDMDEVDAAMESIFDRYDEPASPPSPKPGGNEKIRPSTEMEFELLIQNIRQTTHGEARRSAAETVATMIHESSLSKKAKMRVLTKQRTLLEGV